MDFYGITEYLHVYWLLLLKSYTSSTTIHGIEAP